MNETWNSCFDLEDEAETELLEASTGFSILEEEPDNSEMLRVLERQIGTLQVQLDNLEDDLALLAQQPTSDEHQREWVLRLSAQAERLSARIEELEAQADALSNI